MSKTKLEGCRLRDLKPNSQSRLQTCGSASIYERLRNQREKERFEDGFKKRSSRACQLLQEEIAHDCTSERDLTTASTSGRDRHQGPPASLRSEGKIARKIVDNGIAIRPTARDGVCERMRDRES